MVMAGATARIGATAGRASSSEGLSEANPWDRSEQ